ncbi:MAG: glycosyltransferase family 39 protein [Clostridiales bacterium]|nr:glycosyltransferase family 39 protein [Clostridiales bacterium]
MSKTGKKRDDLLFGGLWVLFTAAFAAFFFLLCCKDSISYDSSYQFFLTDHDMAGIFKLLPEDYSPPLYSFCLKAFSLIFGVKLIALRAFSIVLFALLFFVALFPLRRLGGKAVSVIAAVAFLCSSYNLFYGVEIRPTILAYVMSTCTVTYAMLVFFDKRKSDIVIFSVFSLASMYTHNVALIFTFCMYVFFLLASLISKRKDLFFKYLISGITVAVLYLPWLFVLLHQLGNVQDYFWTDTEPVFFGYYIAFVGFSENYLTMVFSYIFILVLVLAPLINVILITDKDKLSQASSITRIVSKKDMKENWPNLKKLLFLFAVTVISITVFYVVTVTVTPIFAVRYLYVFSGAGIITLSFLFSLCKGKKIMPAVFSVLMALVLISNVVHEYRYLKTTTKDDLVTDINALSGGDPVFIHFDEQSLGVMSYTFRGSRHYVSPETDTVLQTFDVFTTDIRYLNDPDEIWNETDEFYIFNAVNFDNYGITDPAGYYLYFFDDQDIDIEVVGRYKLPYCNEIGYSYGENLILRVTHR